MLPAGAVAGWDLHPLESAALSRRTPEPVIGQLRLRCDAQQRPSRGVVACWSGPEPWEDTMRRRDFITLLGGAAAAWPLAARAQQPAMPVIGFLNPQSPDTYAGPLRALRQGLKDAGYVEGENVAIEYRWAEGQYRSAAGAGSGACSPSSGRHRRDRRRCRASAKAATTTIPIVFNVAARSGQAWSCRQPRPAGRQSHRQSTFSRSSWRRNGWSLFAIWYPAWLV